MKKVLFLCTGNSCRSQMAEGFLRAFGKDAYEAHSAGTRPSAVNPLAVQVMREVGIDISMQQMDASFTTYSAGMTLLLEVHLRVRGVLVAPHLRQGSHVFVLRERAGPRAAVR